MFAAKCCGCFGFVGNHIANSSCFFVFLTNFYSLRAFCGSNSSSAQSNYAHCPKHPFGPCQLTSESPSAVTYFNREYQLSETPETKVSDPCATLVTSVLRHFINARYASVTSVRFPTKYPSSQPMPDSVNSLTKS